MKWSDAEKMMRHSLTNIYAEGEAGAIANRVMEALTGRNQSQRMIQSEEVLTDDQLSQWREYQSRLLKQEPVQYVLRQAPFYGLELYVDRNVLIPRPETEELVQWIIDDVKKSGKKVFTKGATDADRTSELKILDIGTGSGCIPLALKKAMPLAEVWGCDVSEEALTVARRNGSTLDLRVDFQGVNILDEEQQRLLPSVDILVSNPPYIPQSDAEAMHPNVLAYEPHLALFVPNDDALLFYKAIALFSHRRLHEGGSIYLEVHEDHAQEVKALFSQEGYSDVVVKRDMQGKERFVRVRKA